MRRAKNLLTIRIARVSIAIMATAKTYSTLEACTKLGCTESQIRYAMRRSRVINPALIGGRLRWDEIDLEFVKNWLNGHGKNRTSSARSTRPSGPKDRVARRARGEKT